MFGNSCVAAQLLPTDITVFQNTAIFAAFQELEHDAVYSGRRGVLFALPRIELEASRIE
jgi:hypothetical protein